MADAKIVDFTEDTTPANGDFLVTVDVSDTTDDATGTNKKVQISNVVTPARALPSQTGNSGKYLTTDGSTASWGTVSGGGGQTTVTKVVAASGGDYTTLSAAIAAASAGWEIKIMPGTYTEGGFTTSLTNLTITGANYASTVLQFSSNNVSFNGANLLLRDVNLDFTSGTLTTNAANQTFERIYVSKNGANHGWLMLGNYSIMRDSQYINSTSSAGPSQIGLTINGTGSIVDSCFLKSTIVNNNSGSSGQIRLYGNNITVANSTLQYNSYSSEVFLLIYGAKCRVENCHFEDILASSNGVSLVNITGGYTEVSNSTFIAPAGYAITLGANEARIIGNYIDAIYGVTNLSYVSNSTYTDCVIANNRIYGHNSSSAYPVRFISNYSTNNRFVVNGNTLSAGAKGIHFTGASNLVVSNNILYGVGTSNGSYGIQIGANYSVISGNNVANYNNGLEISSGATKCVVGDNILLSNGTNYTDSGTSTSASNNVTA